MSNTDFSGLVLVRINITLLITFVYYDETFSSYHIGPFLLSSVLRFVSIARFEPVADLKPIKSLPFDVVNFQITSVF